VADVHFVLDFSVVAEVAFEDDIWRSTFVRMST
jgi:hypothetical protein